MPKPVSPSLSQKRTRSSSSSFISNSLDLTVATSSGLKLQNLSDHGPIIALQVLQVRLGQSAYPKNNFLISQPKHMLWVLNETVLLSTQNIC